MGNLLDKFNEMTKEAGIQQADPEVSQEELEVLQKYAEYADGLLGNEFGDDYEAADVEKLASMLIDYDMAVTEQDELDREKVAEYYEAGVIQARGFADELVRISNE